MNIKSMLERADMNTIQTFLQCGCDGALETTVKTYEERIKDARTIAMNFFESRFTDIDELDEVTRDFDIQSEVYKDVYFEIGLIMGAKIGYEIHSKAEELGIS